VLKGVDKPGSHCTLTRLIDYEAKKSWDTGFKADMMLEMRRLEGPKYWWKALGHSNWQQMSDMKQD